MSLRISPYGPERGRTLWRLTLVTHRWLGIAMGFVVFLWCVSGIVMMYERYPALDAREALAGLSPIAGADCCDVPLAPSTASSPAQSYRLERLGESALLRIGNDVIDLGSGRRVASWNTDRLLAAGTAYAERRGWASPGNPTTIERDQWTVQGRFDPHRPLLKFANADGRHWYVSSSTAEVIQVTTRSERFWNWLGAVPHWLYPTMLRQHPVVWAQVVIWLTIVGLFLTITGLIIGVKQFRWRHRADRSPYRGWKLWHHYAGIFFGLFTLTWLVSGLLSMNPWGLLESRTFAAERQILNGVPGTVGQAVSQLRKAVAAAPPDTVRIESAYWLGEPAFIALNSRGQATRIVCGGEPGTISVSEVRRAAHAMGMRNAEIEILQHEDAYYYGLRAKVALPVWRITSATRDRVYLDATSGRLLAGVDRNGRWYRWLFDGLHRVDLHEMLRVRPAWDVVMVLLLTGVTAGVGSGIWIGIRRLRGVPRISSP